MKPHKLINTIVINKPIDEVFEFFSNAENLGQITPDELSFKIVTPLPVDMKAGAVIDYKIVLSGFSFRWKTLISKWNPPFCFIDEQIKGPYKLWHHTHEFEDIGNGTTRMTDTVLFLSPGWFLEPLVHKLFVNKKVKTIFDFRTRKLEELFK